MGYYSSVKFITTKDGWDIVQKHVKEAAPECWTYTADNECATPVCDGKYVLVEHDHIKWYEEFTEVKAFMEAINRLDSLAIPYTYFRLGEDWEDNDRLDNVPYGVGYDDMPDLWLNREIEVEY